MLTAFAMTVLAVVTSDQAGASGGWMELDALAAFQKPYGQWQFVGQAAMSETNPRQLTVKPGQGVLYNGPTGQSRDLLTSESFGDAEVHVEFLIPRQSNSGIKFQGHYEIQIFDSHGKQDVNASDCGGIYPRAELLPLYRHLDKGIPPRSNAARPAGEWQELDVTFLAPRFNAAGAKVANARFVKVVLNGVVIHDNVELQSPTGHNWRNKEVPKGPLLLQGDHGPVAFRNLRVRAGSGSR